MAQLKLQLEDEAPEGFASVPRGAGIGISGPRKWQELWDSIEAKGFEAMKGGRDDHNRPSGGFFMPYPENKGRKGESMTQLAIQQSVRVTLSNFQDAKPDFLEEGWRWSVTRLRHKDTQEERLWICATLTPDQTAPTEAEDF